MSLLNTILQYFFQPLPNGNFKFIWLWVGISLLLFISAIILGFILKKAKDDKVLKKLFKKLPYHLLILSICFGLYLLSRYERVPFLSMRILDYILLAITAYITIKNVQIYLKEYPEAKKRREEQVKLNKYLPRKKSK